MGIHEDRNIIQLLDDFQFLVNAKRDTGGMRCECCQFVTKYAVDTWHRYFHIGLLGTQERMVDLSFDQSTIMVFFERQFFTIKAFSIVENSA